MATVDDSLRKQQQDGILAAPTDSSASTSNPAPQTKNSSFAPSPAVNAASGSGTPSTVQVALQNNTTATNLYAYVTGLDVSKNGAVFMLQSDGVTPYYPAKPSSYGAPLQANVSIVVGGPGSVRTITIPHLVGGRIWYSQNSPLTFALNPTDAGAALVEPSISNTSDPSYSLRWDFCEFTFNDYELFANITYVDFVSVPTALELTSTDGSLPKKVAGLPSNGLNTICEALQAQQRVDCAGWDQLVVQIKSSTTGTNFLRALSPEKGMVLNPGLFANYYDPYVAQVWSKYQSAALLVDTQSSWGIKSGQVDSSSGLTFPGVGSFPRPSTHDIFTCDSGAFAVTGADSDIRKNLVARLAAALNRSTLLSHSSQPSGTASASDYYKAPITNHYARILHATNLDGRGYAFPYDDVAASDGTDLAGCVSSGAPALLTIYIGGGGPNGAASAGKARSQPDNPIFVHERPRAGRQLVGARQLHRRSLSPPPYDEGAVLAVREVEAPSSHMVTVEDDEKALLMARYRDVASPAPTDLEKGGLVAVKTDGPSSSAATAPDLTVKLALFLHEALLSLWVAFCSLCRSGWALVPRRVAAPIGLVCSRISAIPAVASASAAVSSFATSVVKSAAASIIATLILRPLLVRTVMTAAVLFLTYAATTSGSLYPTRMTAAVIANLTGWLEEVSGAEPGSLLQ
ncbi:hypothetical protein SEPCBS119000_003477 [Sporothrix epigloea]|uniref:GH64 domain-containing protein n=1 Tax=Sporothrix epigloea TaxID=1892477 RepID=A0ABP0DM30_9PEZI